MTEAEWLAMTEDERMSEINRLQRANSRLKWCVFSLSAILIFVSLLFFEYSGRQQRRLNEAWSQLKFGGEEEPEVSLARFRQLHLGMELGQVEMIMGFRGMPGMGSEDEFGYSWLLDGNTVEIQIGMEDGKVRYATLISADGKQYFLPREK